ncbi:MAG: 23S rRNA (adenine(2503)-C(2))-methyltransferase RlmN [Ruminococcaceae bacterium]|nr:23S rRNA (adenine(2503)-C(2))-methyltransferase RlmN [Oscillospiraceae bacterium]
MKINLRDLTYEKLEEFILGLGEPKFRAKQIFKWLYLGINSIDDMTNLSKDLRERLSSISTVFLPEIEEKFVSGIDETRKYLLKLDDGNYIESVLMKYKHGYTICISSQVGCRMGCAFCASTIGGRIRNLTPSEIIGQVMVVSNDLKERISNIVMMGIGEPFDNFENVMTFLSNVSHPDGLNIGHRHITLSTCGIADKIRDLAHLAPQITLSISLHATNDEMRNSIMPVNKKYNIATLMEACKYYIYKTNRRISFEYTLIAGVNDDLKTARELSKLLSGMLCHVNLIPVNAVNETGFKKTDKNKVEEFRSYLENHKIPATVRREMGSDINAACGQLRKNRLDRERCD